MCLLTPVIVQVCPIGSQPCDTTGSIARVKIDGLIRSEYPGDFLQFIEMYTFAKPRHLSEIAGREFFDAVVDTRRVVAVLVRVK